MDATEAMERALELAERGPEADPNPRVGCVLVRAGEVVGQGWHAGAGTPHAEAVALAIAGERAEGATAYVTLEPCAHTGRTPPCAQALIDAGVAAVFHAQSDPHPDAAGGARHLARAGVTVVRDVAHADRARAITAVWTRAVELGRPVVTWKCATTLDGRAAAADGSSRWITSATARADVARLRAECGAVLVGTGSALADDPRLTVRGADGLPVGRQPLRVVLGRRPIPEGARLRDHTAATLFLAHRDPGSALAELAGRGVRHVLLEGGPTLAAAFWRAGLVDRVVAYLAPALLGAGAAVIGDLGLDAMTDIARLDIVDVTPLGGDLRVTALPTSPTT